MRKIIITSFITLDGVLQAPGGPTEDPTGGFKWGGWSAHYGDESTGQAIMKIMNQPFDLLLGRFTYDIFAAYWPYIKNNPNRWRGTTGALGSRKRKKEKDSILIKK